MVADFCRSGPKAIGVISVVQREWAAMNPRDFQDADHREPPRRIHRIHDQTATLAVRPGSSKSTGPSP